MAIYRRGRKWWISFSYKGKRFQRATECRTKREAKAELDGWKTDIRRGHGERSRQVWFSQLGKRYLEEYAKPFKRSWWRDETSLRVLNRYFSCFVDEITPEKIIAFRADRAKKLAPATVNLDLALLSKMLNLAVTWGIIALSPVTKIKPYKLPVSNERDRVLTEDEEERLLKACEPSWPGQADYLGAMIMVALNSGLRVSEVLSLRWQDVNFDFGMITIEATNSKSRRIRRIPMNSTLRQVLQRQREGNESEYVFCKPDGSRFYWIDSAFRTACRRAGIEGFTFHDLRHTFATRLAQRGVPLVTIKDLLGHSTIRMTERYSHATGQRDAVELLVSKKREGFATISTTIRKSKMGGSL